MRITTAAALLTASMLATGCSRTEAPPPSVAADHQAHAHAAHDEHDLPSTARALPEGQRWSTDEPLRTAMSRIRAAVEQAQPKYQSRQLSNSDALALAQVVEDNITYMIANCNLQPQPDAALHLLIARMSNASAALKEDPSREAGVPQLVTVLQDYHANFDHPDWVH